jgi:phosphatidylglycerol---prolipoprotein diacylglyceryl transferase
MAPFNGFCHDHAPMLLLADYWVHDLSPHIVRFTDKIALHWYGLSYVLGFYLCYLALRHLARSGRSEITEDALPDFITYTAIFGAVLGGRIGFMLFYNFEALLHEPWRILQIWDGGMASHGGILGVALFLLWYARRHKLSWVGIGDTLVAGAPLGILTGRLANFINGELFGRITNVPWAVKFPTEVTNEDFLNRYAASHPEPFPIDPSLQHSPEIIDFYSRLFGSREQFAALLHPRHPSQLYEAAGEGLFLFLLLFTLRLKCPGLPKGVLTGLFFLLYAIIRIALEGVREPDASYLAGMTRGQFYSIFMIVIGIAFILWGMKNGRKTQPT